MAVVLIRPEQVEDRASVYALNASAFKFPAEAKLVDRLRREADPYVSLVAAADANVVGHIMFTPVIISTQPQRRIMGLAPMAVAATHRRQGIGTALVCAGLERCARMGYGAVVVLGHPSYYSRFGFRPGVRYGLACEFEAPPGA